MGNSIKNENAMLQFAEQQMEYRCSQVERLQAERTVRLQAQYQAAREINRLKAENQDLTQALGQCMAENEKYKSENNALHDEVCGLRESKQKLTMKLNAQMDQLREQLRRLNARNQYLSINAPSGSCL